MGVKKSIVDRVLTLFDKDTNFDTSGFLKYDLINDDLVYDLAHLNETDRKNLKKLGFEFKWFNAEMTDGLIFYWVIDKPKKIFYTRKLYFNGRGMKEKTQNG